ncbi:MAG: hypothetical protein ACRKFN_14475 [Desulfitobacterium sp.]
MYTQKLPKKILIGEEFGYLRVVDFYGWKFEGGRNRPYWLCECIAHDEPVTKPVRGDALTSPSKGTKSCGCLKKENKSGGRPSLDFPLKDLTGKIFGKLKVISIVPKSDVDKHFYWLCQCECNPEKLIPVRSDKLISDEKKSCGCLPREAPGKTPNPDRLQIGINQYYGVYCKNKKNVPHLTIEEYATIATKQCEYCGTLDAKRIQNRNEFVNLNGITLENPSLGHTLENSKSCCKICSSMKRKLTSEVFARWILQVIAYKVNRNHPANLAIPIKDISRLTSSNPIEKGYAQYQYDAKRKGYRFEFDLLEFEKLVKQPCDYCGGYSKLLKSGMKMMQARSKKSRKGLFLRQCCSLLYSL